MGARARAPRATGAVPPRRPHLRALPHPRRTAHHAAVVVRDGRAAAPAIAAVEEGRVRFTPERFARVYLEWMRNVRPWCVSRQIWWGHRIPVWYRPDGHLTVEEEAPSACAECGAAELRQEEDVLDTWFSSALYPFATLGWPDETPELEKVLPGLGPDDRARHHLPLGRTHDLLRARAARREALRPRSHPLDAPQPPGASDVEDARHGYRPRGRARAVRCRRNPVRARQGDLDAGRALLVRLDRGGPQARDQAAGTWRG